MTALSSHASAVPDEVPAWFLDALATSVQVGSVPVAGVEVAYRRWGPPTGRGVVLVHGGAAHARWWDAVAPFLGERPVVAIDLSGHGDSGWRTNYSGPLWVEEVLGAAEALLPPGPVVVGHSMGGLIALLAAREPGNPLSGVIVVDSPLNDAVALPDVEPPTGARSARMVQDASLLIERFRPMFDSGRIPTYLRDHAARHSVRYGEGGFRWKFDPRFRLTRRITDALPPAPERPLVFVRPEEGLSNDEMFALLREQPGGSDLRVVDLPAAGHNPMLEDPRALAALLRDLLDDLDGADGRCER